MESHGLQPNSNALSVLSKVTVSSPGNSFVRGPTTPRSVRRSAARAPWSPHRMTHRPDRPDGSRLPRPHAMKTPTSAGPHVTPRCDIVTPPHSPRFFRSWRVQSIERLLDQSTVRGKRQHRCAGTVKVRPTHELVGIPHSVAPRIVSRQTQSTARTASESRAMATASSPKFRSTLSRMPSNIAGSSRLLSGYMNAGNAPTRLAGKSQRQACGVLGIRSGEWARSITQPDHASWPVCVFSRVKLLVSIHPLSLPGTGREAPHRCRELRSTADDRSLSSALLQQSLDMLRWRPACGELSPFVMTVTVDLSVHGSRSRPSARTTSTGDQLQQRRAHDERGLQSFAGLRILGRAFGRCRENQVPSERRPQR